MEQNTLSATRYQPKPTTIAHRADASLRGYLKEVSALEVQAYNQKRLISKLAAKAASLGKYRNIEEPRKPAFSIYNLAYTKNPICIIFGALAMTAMIMFLLFLLAGEPGAGVIFILASIIFIAIALLPDYFDYKSETKRYRRAMEQYKNSRSNDSLRVKHELLAKAEIEHQMKYVKSELEKTQRTLNSIYSLGIIHGSYRNLVAVCSFYDYFDKGICTCLEGPGGAYKFYEEELRFKRIETRLDVIISKLDEIIANQQQLASLIKEGNAALNRIEQQNNRMATTLDNIQENTAVTAYNSQCAAHSAAVMESIAIYRTLKYD